MSCRRDSKLMQKRTVRSFPPEKEGAASNMVWNMTDLNPHSLPPPDASREQVAELSPGRKEG